MGFAADTTITVPSGEVDDESIRLMETTRRSLEAAIDQVVEGHRLGDVGAAVEGIAERAGFSVVREYVGHGIGTAMHEDPQVPNFGDPGRGRLLALCDGFLSYVERRVFPGGCFFVAASAELGARPGPVHDLVARYRVGRHVYEGDAPYTYGVPPGALHVHPANVGDTELHVRQMVRPPMM